MALPVIAYTDRTIAVHHGDCLDVLPTLADSSVDAVVTDPPYGLEFMGREWDTFKPAQAQIRTPSQRDAERGTEADPFSLYTRNRPDAYVAGTPFQKWCESWALECLRVLKPGGHLLAFGGTRTSHRLTCRDRGRRVRDPRRDRMAVRQRLPEVPRRIEGHRRSAAGAEREVIGQRTDHDYQPADRRTHHRASTSATSSARRRDSPGDRGRGASVDRVGDRAEAGVRADRRRAAKPLAGTVARNVLAHGTGALNIDACRIGQNEEGQGRWPANVVLDEDTADELDEQSGTLTSGVLAAHHKRRPKDAGILGAFGSVEGERGYGDAGRRVAVLLHLEGRHGNERVIVDGHRSPDREAA
jgi:hypothetical protein